MLDRLATLLISRATSLQPFTPKQVVTPVNVPYMGLAPTGEIIAVVLERGGCCLEHALNSIVPNCRTGRILIQHSPRTGEPELHYLSLPPSISSSSLVLLLDAQMSSGGAGLMAVRVLVDHGVAEEKVVFCAVVAGRRGVGRLLSVFPDIRVVLAAPFADAEGNGGANEEGEDRWIERKYLGC
jgi:uridine kinase